VIKGKGVSLHTIDKEHLEDVYRILMLDDIGSCFTTTHQELRFNGLVDFLYQTEQGTSSKVFTIKDDSDIIIGFITLNNIHQIRQSAYIGVVGIDPKYQGSRSGVEALKTLIDYAFNNLNLHRVYGHTYSNNPKMAILYKRYGWRNEGVEKEYIKLNNEWIDKENWAVLDYEWREYWSKK